MVDCCFANVLAVQYEGINGGCLLRVCVGSLWTEKPRIQTSSVYLLPTNQDESTH